MNRERPQGCEGCDFGQPPDEKCSGRVRRDQKTWCFTFVLPSVFVSDTPAQSRACVLALTVPLCPIQVFVGILLIRAGSQSQIFNVRMPTLTLSPERYNPKVRPLSFCM
jgi:hypothetical protein